MHLNGNVTASWKQVGALAAAIIVAISVVGGGVFGVVNSRISDAQSGVEGRVAEDRDIRGVIERSSDALRQEISKLGDRLVESNNHLVAQIDKMRDEVVRTMKEGDDRLERRFDRLDEKFDTLLSRIDYDVIEIRPDQVPVVVDKEGFLLGPDGNHLGTLPAVLKLE